MTTPVHDILQCNGLSIPDGRALHNYQCPADKFAQLEKSLYSIVALDRLVHTDAAGFVYWAAEHIRARFPGGKLTWTFVLDHLRIPEDQGQARDLVERGMKWWGREVRLSYSGHRMFLYSLMAEGGIPEALLKEPGLYRNVVMGLLADLEAEGGLTAKHWAGQIAERWSLKLPQAFQSEDFRHLMADLVVSLVELRSLLPAELPETVAEQWLIQYVPDWKSRIPLRMTHDIVEVLIRPALRAKREPISTTKPLCRRELRRDSVGCWNGYLTLNDAGWLPVQQFPEARGLRLRLLPTEANSLRDVSYTAKPEPDGWRLDRFGVTREATVRFSPYGPFSLTAFADGQIKGEAVVDPGIPFPEEAPSFWRATNSEDGTEATVLAPLSGMARTTAPCLWLLMPESMEPVVGPGLTLEELEEASEGLLWRISGNGALSIGNEEYRVHTGAEEEAPDARLIAFGDNLGGWRPDSCTQVFRGHPTIYGQIGNSLLKPIPIDELRYGTGQVFGSQIVEWVQHSDVLGRLRLVRLPAATRFHLREDAPGRVTFTASGLEDGWRARLQADQVQVNGDSDGSTLQLILETPGKAPGVVKLRLSKPATGFTLNLQAPWPARKGMILDPQGVRLARSEPVSVRELYGWRVIAPQTGHCDVVLRLVGQDAISLPVKGESPLTAYEPTIQAMLAQGGPDAQLNLYLVVDGQESSRLEIRRYHGQTLVKDGVLHAGLKRDETIPPEGALAVQLRIGLGDLTFQAFDINRPDEVRSGTAAASFDICAFLGNKGGPWLIQSRLEDRIQRAAVWNSETSPHTLRSDRIETYAENWRQLVNDAENPEWERLWQLIAVAARGGDAGVLDQTQALDQVPAALVVLAFRVSPQELGTVLALDTAAPIFWPILPVSDFGVAIASERLRLRTRLSFLDNAVAETVDDLLIKRVQAILTLRPELAGHFGKTLIDVGLFGRLSNIPDYEEILKSLLVSDPVDRLNIVAQEAARRFNRLPEGVNGLTPMRQPIAAAFDPYIQKVVDAPLVAAEMASGQRTMAGPKEKLILTNLRLVDPIYFDQALPAALACCFMEA